MTPTARRSGIWLLIPCASLAGFPQDPPARPLDPAPAPSYPDHSQLLIFRDPQGRPHPVQSPADWQIRRNHILAHLQTVMGPLPQRPASPDPPSAKIIESTNEQIYTRKKVAITLDDGGTLPAWLFLPDGPRARRPAVLCLHQTTAIGKDEPAGLGGLADLHYARELALRGYVALAPDYPRFGDHKVDPYALGYASATMKAIADNRSAIDYLAARPEVDPARIAAIGHSLGGHNALFTATFDPRIQAVVTSCGFTSFPRYYKGNIAGWSHAGYMPRLKSVFDLEVARVPFDFPEILAVIAPRPIFINAPIHDDNFDIQGVRDSVAAARPVFELLHAPADSLVLDTPDAPHTFPPDIRARAYAFLDRVLRHTPPPLNP